jgi:hypothetical protein
MRLSSALAVLAFAGTTCLDAAVLVTVVPQNQTIAPGASTGVQVRISGLGSDIPPSLGAFDFNLAFNPAIVTFTGLTFGDPVLGDQLDLSGAGPLSDFSTMSAGFVNFYEISLDPAATLDSQQLDSFVLATLRFQALATGTTSLVPSINSISDSQGASLNPGLQMGSINVVAVPEPGSLWLAAVAACLLICARHVSRRPQR